MLYWEEDEETPESGEPENEVVDIVYRLNCKTLPVDHAQALADALHQALPWLGDEEGVGIHSIHIAESGNGWYRPEGGLLQLSKRTRLTLRIPDHRLEDARALHGQQLDVGGYPLGIGDSNVKKLSKLTTLFSRYMVADNVDDEAAYMEAIYKQLVDKGIKPKKMMAGKKHSIASADGVLESRMLMLAELELDASLRLQREGLGPGRKLGCGIFIPHKGIEAVNKEQKNR